MHSFGLYSQDRNGRVYQFALTRGQGPLLQQINETGYLINILTLWLQFEASVSIYRDQLTASEALQEQFSQMFPKYGLLGIGG